MSFLHSLIFTSLFLSILYDSHADNIGNVCPKTENPPLCDKFLRSAPGGSGGDYNVLSRIAFDRAVGATARAKNLVSYLFKQSRDPVLTDRYNACLMNFIEVVQRLDSCRQALRNKDYISVGVYANIAYNVGADCDRLFSTPPIDIQLMNASKQSQDYSNFVCVIARIASGEYNVTSPY